MQSKEAYLNAVCEQIRFRAARKPLRAELSAHIDDKTAELQSRGAANAEAEAISAMGDAKEVGKALRAVHKPRKAWGVIACVLLLSIAGIAAAYAGSEYPYDNYGQTLWTYFQSSLPIYLPLGISLTIGLYLVDYTLLFRLRHLFIGIAFLLAAVYILFYIITMFLPPGYYNSFWPGLAAFVSLPFFTLGIAGYIYSNKDKRIKVTVRITILCVLSVLAISLFSPEFSLLFAFSYVAMIFVNTYNSVHRKKWLHFIIAAGVTIIIIVPYLFFALTYSGTAYTTENGTEISNIFTVSTYSYQIVQDTLKGANIVGAAPQLIQSQGWPSYGSMPAYIIAAVIGAYGWLATAAIVLVFLALFVFLIRRSRKISEPFGRLLTSGITFLYFIRFAFFIFSCTIFANGLSFNLPFLNCGSSFYIIDAFLIGIFLSVWRRSSLMTSSISLTTKGNPAKIQTQ